MSYFTLCGEKKPSLKNSRMRQLSTNSNGKGILSCVIIIVASLYSQWLGRTLQEFYLTDWMNTLNRQVFYQKASVDSERQRNNWHDLHSKAASREMPGTEHGPLHDLTKAFDTVSREGLENYGEVCLSDQVHSNGEAVPRWHTCTGPKRWWVFLIIYLWQIVLSKAVY